MHLSTLRLCVLLALAVTWCQAMSVDEARSALEKALNGCKNKQLCCTICTDTDPCVEVCAGDKSAPKTHLGECKSSYSIIGSALRFRHTAHDYRLSAQTGGGCAPCGQAGAAPGTPIADVGLTRVHFRDTDIRTSLGLRTGFTWDIWLTCYAPGLIASGHPTSVPGWQIMVSQPQSQPLDFLVLTDATGTGQFKPEQGYSNRSLTFYAADGTVTPLPTAATSAILRLWDGAEMEFEVYVETDATQPIGRLTRYVDRNGNALTSTWKYAVDDPAMTGSLRTKLAIRDRLTDAHGRSIGFTWDEKQQYSGRWVCIRADLPDGNHVSYRYGTQANTNIQGTEVCLIGVDHPDGSVSTFDAVADPTVPGLRWTVDDPAADSAHSRRKTVWLSQSTWINPANPQQKIGQIFGRAVRVDDGAGTTAFLGWFGTFTLADGSTESRTYTWDRGVMTAFAHQDGYKPGGAYTWEGPAGADLFDRDWSGWRKTLDRGYTGSTLPGTLTTPEGFSATYERDPVSQRQIRAVYQDGTIERWVRNGLGDVTLHRDRLGRLTETTYDAVGNRLAVTRGWIAANPDDLDARTAPDGLSSESWQYWSAADAGLPGAGLPGQLKAHIDANGNRTDYQYEADGDLSAVVRPADVLGGVRPADQRTYDAAGHLIQRLDERGIATRFAYDACGRLVTTTFADGSTETVSYATTGIAAGLDVAWTDRNGNRETLTWDAAGRRSATERRDHAGLLVGRRAWTYVPGTLLVASELIDGDLTTYGYDAEQRRVSTTRQVSGGSSLTETQVYAGDRQVASIDPFGRRTLLVRDAEERVVRVVRERLAGAVPADADPALLARIGGTNPPYVLMDSVFDAEGQLVARIDGNGVRNEAVYDALGRLVEQREAVGTAQLAVMGYAYDAVGNRIASTGPRTWIDASGQAQPVATRMTYTGRNLLATVTEAAGSPEAVLVRALSYTATGKVAAEWDANQAGKAANDPTRVATQYIYGGCCDRLVAVTDPAGFVSSFGYDFHGNRTTATDPNGLTTRTVYDGRNRPVAVTNAAGETVRLAYDDDLTDGLGLDTDTAVAALLPSLGYVAGRCDGSAMQQTDALGQRTITVSDGLGRVVARIDALGQVTRQGYDALQADGTVAQTVTDPLGHTTQVRADGLGHAVVSVDALGQATTQGFDANGNPCSQTTLVAAEALGWTATYDARNRMDSRSDTRTADRGTTRWSYDAAGNRVAELDASDQAETSTYDLRNRRTALTDRLGGVTRFAYDQAGNLLQIADAESTPRRGRVVDATTTQYAYDVRHLLVAEAFPLGQRGRTLRTYAYDAGRRLVQRQVGLLAGTFTAAPRFLLRPEPTAYVYDAANRLVVRGYADGADDGFGYDAAGRLVLASSGRYGNQVMRSYDAAGRLLGEQLTIASGVGLLGRVLLPAQYGVGYAYDADNQVTAITYPDGRTATMTHTARHQLAQVGFDGAVVASRGYDAAGRLTQTTFGNGVLEARTYVPGDQLVAGISASTMTGAAVTGFAYTYDVDRRKTTETDVVRQGGSQVFAYDAAGRLVDWRQGADATTPAHTQQWSLSLVGDWRSTTRDGATDVRQHSAVHETTRVGPTQLAYDDAGNLTRDERGQRLAWDPENRLRVARHLTDAADPAVAGYAYDALGRRVSVTVAGIRTDYVSAGAQVVQTYAVRATVRRSDLRSDGQLADLRETPAGGGLLPTARGAVVRRVNFQPAYVTIPAGYLGDAGRTLARRTNGLTYGWTAQRTASAAERGVVSDPAWDTLIAMDGASWRMALPNGSYTVALIAGDAARTDIVNNLIVNGVVLMDPEVPPPSQPRYTQGDFDGWVTTVTVRDGYLTIAAGAGAIDPRLCLVEISPRNARYDLATVRAALDAQVASLTSQTAGGGNAALAQQPRSYVYGSYVDEVIAFTSGSGASTSRYYVHSNHLYSPSAITDSTGAVVELYKYDAAGRQTITSVGSVVRSKSAVGFDRSFTGYRLDAETGLLYAQTRMYSPTLGRFISRDPWMAAPVDTTIRRQVVRGRSLIIRAGPRAKDGYPNGASFYQGYFVPNHNDPSGMSPPIDRPWNDGPDAPNPCNGYNAFIPGRQCLMAGGWINDPYPAAAKAVCNNFMTDNQWNETVTSIANCLVAEEAIAQKIDCCDTRNKQRVAAHIRCYAAAGWGGFMLGAGWLGGWARPDGSWDVGIGQLFPSLTHPIPGVTWW
jgi:RHS repeat-associated protein